MSNKNTRFIAALALAGATTLSAGCQQEISSSLSRPLNDTGVVSCANVGGDTNSNGWTSSNNLDCASTGASVSLSGLDGFGNAVPLGQDGVYGRDASHNDDSDGLAGFSFTKLDSAGEVLAAEATSWDCLLDNVTGLMWEAKSADGGLHDRGDRYYWYNSDSASNGGSPGHDGSVPLSNSDPNDPSYVVCTGYNADDEASLCNTEAFAARVNAATLCGKSDWRMPTTEELLSLISFDDSAAGVDASYFPHTQRGFYFFYWSADPPFRVGGHPWMVNLGSGRFYSEDYDLGVGGALYVQLVRSSP